MKDVSFIIKTFERPAMLERLIRSIKKFYPDVPILVADDSKRPTVRSDVEYYTLPFDKGVSYGRNYLVNRVKTKYFITLDDDWIFLPETKIENFIDIIETNDIDILAGLAGGPGCEAHAAHRRNFNIVDGTLSLFLFPESEQNPYFTYCDFPPQFFIAETEKFKTTLGGWDDDLKTRGEHIELFIRAKQAGLKTAITHNVRVFHNRTMNGNADYTTFRKRDFLGIAMSKHGIEKVIQLNGRQRHFNQCV